MFDDKKYYITTEFKSIDDLREWMAVDGHLWFYIDDQYYFLNASRNYDDKCNIVPWWYIVRGDFRDVSYPKDEIQEDILWEFYDTEEVWRAPIFNGKSFEKNFSEFIFYD